MLEFYFFKEFLWRVNCRTAASIILAKVFTVHFEGQYETIYTIVIYFKDFIRKSHRVSLIKISLRVSQRFIL